MEIEICNIKTWENLNLHIDINDFKHILICGISGIGKTTILDCIYFAITGGCLTNKWSIRHKRKKAHVKLQFIHENITISRTLNPKSVQVSINDNVTTGDKAQELINAKFGLFKQIGYLQQKSTYSYFISMSPKDRMSFIEDVFFNELDIDTVKNSIKDEIDVAKSEYIVHDIQISKLTLKNIQPIVKEKDITGTQQFIDLLINQQTSLLNSVNDVHVYKSMLQESQLVKYELMAENSDVVKKINTLTIFIKQNEPKINLYKRKISEYEEHAILKQKHVDISTHQISQLRDLENKLVDLDELNEQIIIQEKLMELYSNFLTIEKRIKALNFNEQVYTSKLAEYQNTYLVYNECPTCHTLLGANFTGIYSIKGDEQVISNDKLIQLKQTITEMESKQHRYKILKEILDDLESKLQFPIWTEYELEEAVKNKQLQETYHVQYNELKQNYNKSLTIPPSPNISKLEYESMKNIIDTYNTYIIQITYVTEQLEKNKIKLNTINDKIIDITNKLEESTNQMNQLNSINLDLAKYKATLTDLKDTFEYQQVYYKYIEKKQVWDDYIMFQKIFNKIQSNVIMYTLNSINALIKKYVDGFFENYNLQFTFYVNNVKNCIDVNIEYDNSNPADLSILSGGEYDRVVLAIVLAFGEFYKMPLLLLDEIMNSLDLHTLQLVMTHIHKCYPENQAIIYVGHQMISGNFDNVIDLDLQDDISDGKGTTK